MKFTLTIISFLSIFSITNIIAQTSSENYFQKIKTDISLPKHAGKNVITLLKQNENIFAITDTGIFKHIEGIWITVSSRSGWKTACQDLTGKVWVASNEIISDEKGNKIVFPENLNTDTIFTLYWEDSNSLHAGTTDGLWTFHKTWTQIIPTKGKRIYSIVKDYKSNLWLATDDGLLKRKNGTWINLDDHIMTEGNERTYHCLAQQNNGKDIIYSSPYSLGCISASGNHWVKTGNQGLPYGPVTTIKTIGAALWLGTHKGAIKKDSTWHYYHGKRWLSNNQINDILPIDEHTVWIATPDGISQIQDVEMNLEQKAAYFEERIHQRHQRHGLVSRSRLEIPGDISTSKPAITHNDGLWTSIYLVSQCFHYAATGDKLAKKNAKQAFEAMERLESVTSIRGFPARSLAKYNEETPAKGEWHLSPDGKWKWLGDTSSDEMVGHFFAYPVFYDLVADDKYKMRVKSLVKRILDHIVDNDFSMTDIDGKPTRWGVWNPDSLNHSMNWYGEKGLNSLQILTFLKAGYYITKDLKFENACQKLIQDHNYAENILQQKMYGPFEMNFVDNQLSFLPYYVISRYSDDEKLLPFLRKSIDRSWKIIQKDQIAMWNIITSAVTNKNCDLDIALNELQSIPMDMIDWTMENSHRWDLQKDVFKDRLEKRQAVHPVPVEERGITKWNLNVYGLDLGKNGMNENDGAYFLLGYWMGRYHGFFK